MKKFWIDCLLATLFVFFTLGGILKITDLKVFNAFDPLSQALGDMELTDIAFSQLRDDPDLDTNIVIVNIGNLSRREVGQQIQIISKYKPKIIGIDSFFDCPGNLRDTISCPALIDVMGNALFADAIREAGNVVLVTKILQSDSLIETGAFDIYDSLEQTDADLRGNAIEGYANLDTDAENQESFKACRRFNPTLVVSGSRQNAFSVQVAMQYDSVKTLKFLERNNDSEIINYRGNIPDFHGASSFAGRYYALDWYQVLNEDFLPGLIKDKIVLFGFLGSDFTDTSWDDKFFTPLNKQYAGKANPDMFGLVVHANIVSMILSEDYVEELANWQQYAIAFVVVLLNVALFFLINRKIPVWFDTLSLIIQLAQVLLCSFLMVQFFNWYNFKLNLTMTLACVALVGTCFELYNSLIKTLYSSIKNSRLFTKRNQEVLNP